MKSIKVAVLGWIVLMFVSACSSKRQLNTVNSVNLEKYAGRWYDIAHLPQRFQKGCKCVTADYTVLDAYVRVRNTCVNEETGKITYADGKAFPVDGSGNSKLAVQFFWPFRGDYYIIALEEDYSYAMVGSPDRESLWILSRDPQPAAVILKKYFNKAEEMGFETINLEYTDQSCHATRDIKQGLSSEN